MTQKGLFERYKHLIYAVLTLAVGISILISNESIFITDGVFYQFHLGF
jgi:cadmium resistance protein CadD (predicted permease)